jgi:hypothetical protein
MTIQDLIDTLEETNDECVLFELESAIEEIRNSVQDRDQDIEKALHDLISKQIPTIRQSSTNKSRGRSCHTALLDPSPLRPSPGLGSATQNIPKSPSVITSEDYLLIYEAKMRDFERQLISKNLIIEHANTEKMQFIDQIDSLDNEIFDLRLTNSELQMEVAHYKERELNRLNFETELEANLVHNNRRRFSELEKKVDLKDKEIEQGKFQTNSELKLTMYQLSDKIGLWSEANDLIKTKMDTFDFTKDKYKQEIGYLNQT